MKTSFALAVAAASLTLASAFLPPAPLPTRRAATALAAWTPDRAPQTNPGRSGLSADASFDRAVIRAETDYMDNDQQNPPSETKWWEAYYPSQEEQEAAAAGFDFSNPEKWLEAPKEGVKMDPPSFEASEGFTYASREWPELKKVVKA